MEQCDVCESTDIFVCGYCEIILCNDHDFKENHYEKCGKCNGTGENKNEK